MVAGPKTTLERELKLSVTRQFRLPDLLGEPLPDRVLTSTYFDTDDFRLARYGVTLRRRVEARKGAWQLKLPRDSARAELEVPGGPSAPPELLVELATAYSRGRPLEPIVKLRTRRSGKRVSTDGGLPVADVTLDVVSVIRGGHVVGGFREVEAELVDGNEKALARIAATLRQAGAGDGDPRPKPLQALGLPEPSTAARPAAKAPFTDHLRYLLEVQYQAILAHDPGTRLGEDAEELHQMRVSTRRLRAFLRAARPLLDQSISEPLRAEIGWLGSVLGPVRDLDVLIEHLQQDASTLEVREQRALRPLFAALEEERATDRTAMIESLRTPRYVELLDRLEALVADPPVTSPDASVRELAAAEYRRLRKIVRALPADPTDDELHDVRIRGKRARYAAELAEIATGKQATRFIEDAKALQDVLGDHQDAAVAEDRIRSIVSRVRSARLAFASGRLVEREQERKRAARAAFPRVWKQLDARGKAAWR